MSGQMPVSWAPSGFSLLAGLALLAGTTAAGRSAAGGDGPAAAAPAALEEARFNQVQFKAAHNSIDREESLAAQLDWDPREPHQGGARGLELDLVQDPEHVGPDEPWVFGVQHGGAFHAGTPGLVRCLRDIRAWAEAHAAHEVITLHLDLKPEATLGDDQVFIVKLEEILARELGASLPPRYPPAAGDRILAVAHLQREAPTLLAGIERHGWPTLRELRGKFIIVISGGDRDEPVARRRRTYLTTRPRERLAFVDLDQRAATTGIGAGFDECEVRNPYYNEGSRVFINIELGRRDWMRLASEAHERGFVTREWKANDEAGWSKAQAARVNVLSTDRIRGFAWAKAGSQLFALIPPAAKPEKPEKSEQAEKGKP